MADSFGYVHGILNFRWAFLGTFFAITSKHRWYSQCRETDFFFFVFVIIVPMLFRVYFPKKKLLNPSYTCSKYVFSEIRKQ